MKCQICNKSEAERGYCCKDCFMLLPIGTANRLIFKLLAIVREKESETLDKTMESIRRTKINDK